jgi:hypothetical protein
MQGIKRHRQGRGDSWHGRRNLTERSVRRYALKVMHGSPPPLHEELYRFRIDDCGLRKQYRYITTVIEVKLAKDSRS